MRRYCASEIMPDPLGRVFYTASLGKPSAHVTYTKIPLQRSRRNAASISIAGLAAKSGIPRQRSNRVSWPPRIEEAHHHLRNSRARASSHLPKSLSGGCQRHFRPKKKKKNSGPNNNSASLSGEAWDVAARITQACNVVSVPQHHISPTPSPQIADPCHKLTISSSVRALVSIALKSVLTAIAVKRHLNMCPRRQGTLVRPLE